MRFFRCMLASFLLSGLAPVLARAQMAAGPISRSADTDTIYPDSAVGLRLQLRDALAAAREHDRPKLESLVRQMEIPSYKAWFVKTYGQVKGESWAVPYGRELPNRENDLVAAFMEFGMEAGDFATRKVNDAPAPGMEAGMIGELQQPVNVFYAAWKTRGLPLNSMDSPIGYFVYLDGRFRWDSTVVLIKIQQDQAQKNASPQPPLNESAPGPSSPPASGTHGDIDRPGSGGVGFPTCFYCPAPQYSELARKKGLEGRVVLQVIVQVDGTATDLQVVKSPSPELAEMAIEGVSKWRFNPARRADGEAVPVSVPIEVTFRINGNMT